MQITMEAGAIRARAGARIQFCHIGISILGFAVLHFLHGLC
ncbi:hypothetical protein [Dongshaea marina]|nr:hypothetical protein [Dongshaea marina]